MIAVFAGFTLGKFLPIKMLGFALSVAVLDRRDRGAHGHRTGAPAPGGAVELVARRPPVAGIRPRFWQGSCGIETRRQIMLATRQPGSFRSRGVALGALAAALGAFLARPVGGRPSRRKTRSMRLRRRRRPRAPLPPHRATFRRTGRPRTLLRVPRPTPLLRPTALPSPTPLLLLRSTRRRRPRMRGGSFRTSSRRETTGSGTTPGRTILASMSRIPGRRAGSQADSDPSTSSGSPVEDLRASGLAGSPSPSRPSSSNTAATGSGGATRS